MRLTVKPDLAAQDRTPAAERGEITKKSCRSPDVSGVKLIYKHFVCI